MCAGGAYNECVEASCSLSHKEKSAQYTAASASVFYGAFYACGFVDPGWCGASGRGYAEEYLLWLRDQNGCGFRG